MKLRKLFVALFSALVVISFCVSADAQLPRDVRDVFESMMDDLDDDLKGKFRHAIKNDTATVEFTPDQFKRFRSNPVNPFEGLDAINVEDGGGNIALKFELPSIRNRNLNPLERQNPAILSQISQPVFSASVSTVSLFDDDRQIAMGVIVRNDGYILTKASEVETRDKIQCVIGDGRRLDAKILRTDKANDLAILKIEATGLPEIKWSNSQVRTGAFVLTPDPNGNVLAMGTYSVSPRSTAQGKQAFLGVEPQTTTKGVRIGDIRPGTASYAAGLKNGDIITKLGGKNIKDVESLVKTIRDRVPGDKVEIEFLRGGLPNKVSATLADRDFSGEQAARFKMMNRLGAIPSRRDGNFPTVFQHDTPLFPEQCGGPITDLDGNVLGINIARKGRAASFAIPSGHVQTVLKDLMRENVASR